MGWKTFQERFEVEHTVHIAISQGSEDLRVLCIGSSYVSQLVEISLETGAILERNSSIGGAKFVRETYPKLFAATKQDVLDALNEDDSFSRSIPVYYFDRKLGECVELMTEEYGYPNVTHDGTLQYSNIHYQTEKEAEEREIDSLTSAIDVMSETIDRKESELEDLNARFERSTELLYKLNQKYDR